MVQLDLLVLALVLVLARVLDAVLVLGFQMQGNHCTPMVLDPPVESVALVLVPLMLLMVLQAMVLVILVLVLVLVLHISAANK